MQLLLEKKLENSEETQNWKCN